MTDTPKTVRVLSIYNPKVEGQYRAPGSEWECPAHLVGELLEVGAIELLAPQGPSREEIELAAQEAERLRKEEQAKKEAAELQRPADILAAIDKLNPEDDSLWTKDKENGPTTKALEAVLGFSVTAAERDAAWAMFNKAMEVARLETIVKAINTIDPENESLWTVDSGPTVEALNAVLEFPVDEAQRDAAWEHFSIMAASGLGAL